MANSAVLGEQPRRELPERGRVRPQRRRSRAGQRRVRLTPRRCATWLLLLAMLAALLSGCGATDGDSGRDLSYDEAVQELDAFYRKVNPTTGTPPLDTDADLTMPEALSDISTFPITVEGDSSIVGSAVVEIAVSTELSAISEPDNWANVMAERFNRAKLPLMNGRTAQVSIRQIPSGEAVTYMVEGGYRPAGFIPSNALWGEMLQAKGIDAIQLTERLVGNTAGILMKKDVYDDFVGKYGDFSVKNVMEATLNKDLVFAVTNPYTSSTGLNLLVEMLRAYDSKNPLSDVAVGRLLEYQKVAPVAAYTTAQMRQSAAKGIVNAMAMEAQAFAYTPELAGYVYTPVGCRHDHPVYTFGYMPEDEREVVQTFLDYCALEEQQEEATKRGFNRYDDYVPAETGKSLSGSELFAAQSVWKKVKNGGRPIIAVFVADTSGSMQGARISMLEDSLLNTMQYISENASVGLVSYDSAVRIELPVKIFDNLHRAYFSGAVKSLKVNGNTATYDAVVVGLKMLVDEAKNVPDAQLMLFVLTDGEQNVGYRLSQIEPLAKGLGIPIHGIAYETSSTGEMARMAGWNEATLTNSDISNITNQLRLLFMVNA